MALTFNPDMLILARESRGLTQSDLGTNCSVQQGTISKIESGVLAPSQDLIQQLSKSLNYPEEFFRQSDRVYGFNSTVFFHRRRMAIPDKVLRRLHAYMNLTRMRVVRLLRAAEFTQCLFQRMEPLEYRGNVEKIAQLVRATWMLPPGPVKNVTRAIEDAGGVVVMMDFGTNQADAISEWISGYPPIFLVNSSADISGDRLRLTLAHEVGHTIMHRFPSPDMEEEANRFAAEFLMPRREIKASLFGLNMGKLAALKQEWGVSMAAIVMHAHRLGCMTDAQKRYAFISLGRAGYRTHEPVEVPLEKATLLAEFLSLHRTQLGYSDEELAQLLLFRSPRQIKEEFALETQQMRLVV